MHKLHSFHIPVMGLAFTADSPVKVAKYGIDSVIPIGDDILLERLRKIYCEKFELPYNEISNKVKDFRAKRITSYLNLMNILAEKKYEELKSTTIKKTDELKDFLNLFPDTSIIKKEFQNLSDKFFETKDDISNWLKDHLSLGSIDVNIMTKLDVAHFDKNGDKLPAEMNDAHSALRGYANSDLASSIVLSAGINPRLYGYISQFDDFFANENGYIKKKIVIKVSDYRSALVQGRFLAKKGLWVSEYRIESGLNCGGHAFATDGYLMGPILAEFRDKKEDLIKATYKVLVDALTKSGRTIPKDVLGLKISAQGGVGTAEEHQFLLDHYEVDSVGWGTPFLLVPEATTVDDHTLNLLVKAKEKDLYLSDVSPLGIPFNSLRGNTKDINKMELVAKGRPGSKCPKHFLSFNTEFTDKPICTASRQYQRLKLKELDTQNLSEKEHKAAFDKIVVKSCLCTGLGTTAFLKYGKNTKVEGPGVLICPGPNMANFSNVVGLKEMVGHIYGKANIVSTDRLNMFIKELNIYVDFLQNKIEETKSTMNSRSEKYLLGFTNNLNDGVDYYTDLFSKAKGFFDDKKNSIFTSLKNTKEKLIEMKKEIENHAVV